MHAEILNEFSLEQKLNSWISSLCEIDIYVLESMLLSFSKMQETPVAEDQIPLFLSLYKSLNQMAESLLELLSHSAKKLEVFDHVLRKRKSPVQIEGNNLELALLNSRPYQMIKEINAVKESFQLKIRKYFFKQKKNRTFYKEWKEEESLLQHRLQEVNHLLAKKRQSINSFTGRIFPLPENMGEVRIKGFKEKLAFGAAPAKPKLFSAPE